jgi:predicted phage replisome organizer
MSDVKWIKLTIAMFDDEKIKLIESMPDKDAILIIWIKLLVLAGKANASGYLYLNKNIPYTDEMLSFLFNRPLNTIRLALDTFKRFGMIHVDEGYLCITNWEKHQNIEGLDKIRAQTRQRVAKFREKQKQLQECNVTETLSNETEVEVEVDIEKDFTTTITTIKPEKFYQDNFGLITPFIAQDILGFIEKGVEEGLIVAAMQLALKNNAPTWNYTSTIIINCMKKNIKTLEQFESHEKNRKKDMAKVTPFKPPVRKSGISEDCMDEIWKEISNGTK